MNERRVSQREAISLLVMYLLGHTTVMLVGREGNRDIWLSVLFAFLMAAPLLLLYGRLLRLFPDKGFFTMIRELFGPVFGYAAMALYILYSLHLGALVIRNSTEFFQIVAATTMPQYFYALLLGVLCIWSLRHTRSVLMGSAVLIAPGQIIFFLLSFFITIPLWHVDHLFPMLADGIKPVLTGATELWGYPYAEMVLLLFLLKPLVNAEHSYRVYLIPAAIFTFLTMIGDLTYILVMGHEEIQNFYYPAYQLYSLIEIGDFIQGVQVPIIILYMFGSFTKGACCLYVASTGVAKLTGLRYQSLVAPVGMLMVILSLFVTKNAMDMFTFASKYYRYYVIPVSVLLPLILWVTAEWKIRRQAAAPAIASPSSPQENAD